MSRDDFNEYKRQLEEMEEEDSFFYKYASEKEIRKQKKKKSKKMKKLAKKAEQYKKNRRNQKRKDRLKAEKEKQRALKRSEKEIRLAERKAEKEAQKLQKEKDRTEVKRHRFDAYDDDFVVEENTKIIIEEPSNEKPKRHPIRALIILLLLAVIVFVLINFNSFSPENISDFMSDIFASNNSESDEIKISDTTIISSSKTDSDIILLTDTSVLNYSKGGALQFDRQHGYQSPRIKTASAHSLVYENMGKKFRIDSRSKNIIEESVDNNILVADISNNKVLALITESEGYTAELTLYDFNFNPKDFKWYSAEHNVIDMSISPKGDKAAIITCFAENGQIKSQLLVLDFSKSEPLSVVDYNGTFLFSVDFKTNTDVTVIGDNLCSTVPVNNPDKKKDYSFKNYNLKLYNNKNSGGSVIVLEKYSDIASNLLVFISSQGEVYFEKLTDNVISAVTVSDKKCVALAKNGLSEFNRDGEEKLIAEQKNEAFLLETIENNSFVIGNSTIKIEKN